jgi:hypothetical protein
MGDYLQSALNFNHDEIQQRQDATVGGEKYLRGIFFSPPALASWRLGVRLLLYHSANDPNLEIHG